MSPALTVAHCELRVGTCRVLEDSMVVDAVSYDGSLARAPVSAILHSLRDACLPSKIPRFNHPTISEPHKFATKNGFEGIHTCAFSDRDEQVKCWVVDDLAESQSAVLVADHAPVDKKLDLAFFRVWNLMR